MSLRADAALPAEALAAIRAPFAESGGVWVDPPILQPLGALLDLMGERMRSRLFIVEGEGAEAAALRADFTVAVAQAHIASGHATGRYLYEGKAFRTAPPGSGRAVEFKQVGVESYGAAADPIAEDAETAALAWRAAAAGGRDDLSLQIGDVGLFSAFMRALGVPEAAAARILRAFSTGRPVRTELMRVQAQTPPAAPGAGRLAHLLADLPEAEAAGVLEELWRLAGIQPVGGRSAAEIVHRLVERSEGVRSQPLSAEEAALIGRYLDISGSPRAALDQIEKLAYEAKVEFDIQLQPWVRRLKALVAAGVPEAAMNLSTAFVRPFGYYDGLLFEIRCASLGEDQPIAAGGRYDALPVRLGGQVPGAVGCIVRPARAWKGAVR